MNYYLGVDVGTSSVKSLLMDSEGKTVGTSQIGYNMQSRIWRSYGRQQKRRLQIL